MAMHRLADIELQLVMHGVTAVERLHFARCSRVILHAADSAFAWRHCTQLKFTFHLKSQPRSSTLSFKQGAGWLLFDTKRLLGVGSTNAFAASPSHPLRHALRHRSLLLLDAPDFICGSKLSGVRELLHELAQHIPYWQPHSFHLLDCDAEGWRRLLSHPTLSSLRVVRQHPRVRFLMTPESIQPLINHMPALHTLELDCSISAEASDLLPRIPALQSLHIADISGSCTQAIVRCPHLTRLSLWNPPMDEVLLPILSSPLMQQNLQWLRIEDWDFKINMLTRRSDERIGFGGWNTAPPQKDYTRGLHDYAAAFFAMRSLHTLQLVLVSELDLFLPMLCLAPALRSLFLHVQIVHPSMSLLRLANVELQLVMHGLSSAELLQFARCSRRLLHAADNAFSWQRTRASLQFGFNGRSHLSSLIQRGKNWLRRRKAAVVALTHPLRHSRLILQVRCPSPFEQPTTEADVKALWLRLSELPVGAMIELDCTKAAYVYVALWNQVFVHPAAQSIQVLRMRALWGLQILDRDSMRFLAGLRGLHTLDLDAADPSGALDFHCANLTELSMRQPLMDPKLLRTFMLSDLMQRNLLTLRFEDMAFAANNTDDFPSAFGLMQGLRSLSFVHVESIDRFLPHLAQAPSLRSLSLQPEAVGIPMTVSLDPIRAYLPSAPVLLAMLAAAPLLHCQLFFYIKPIRSSVWVQQTQYLRSLEELKKEQDSSGAGSVAGSLSLVVDFDNTPKVASVPGMEPELMEPELVAPDAEREEPITSQQL